MRRSIVLVVAVGAVVSLLSMVGWTAFGYGGPPPEDTTWTPQVRAWTFSVNGERLCDDATPCTEADLARATAGDACSWRGIAWLSGRSNPFLLRHVRFELFVVVEQTGGAVGTQEASLPSAGSWWRAYGKQVSVTLNVPCDARMIKISFNYVGTASFGTTYRSSEAAQTSLVGAAP